MKRLALLLLTVALAAPNAASATSRTIVVRIEHSRFIPDSITVRAGEQVRFVVVNGDPIDHEFLIGDRSVQRAHELGTEAHHGAKPGELSLPPSETRVTGYTFNGEGRLIIGCHLPQHFAYGMRGTIVIKGES